MPHGYHYATHGQFTNNPRMPGYIYAKDKFNELGEWIGEEGIKGTPGAEQHITQSMASQVATKQGSAAGRARLGQSQQAIADAAARQKKANEVEEQRLADERQQAGAAGNLQAYTKLTDSRGVYARFLSGQANSQDVYKKLGQDIQQQYARAGTGLSPQEINRLVNQEITRLEKSPYFSEYGKQLQPEAFSAGTASSSVYDPRQEIRPQDIQKYYPNWESGMPMPDMSQGALSRIMSARQQQPRSSTVTQSATGRETTSPVRQEGEDIQSLSARINLFQQGGDWRYKGGGPGPLPDTGVQTTANPTQAGGYDDYGNLLSARTGMVDDPSGTRARNEQVARFQREAAADFGEEMETGAGAGRYYNAPPPPGAAYGDFSRMSGGADQETYNVGERRAYEMQQTGEMGRYGQDTGTTSDPNPYIPGYAMSDTGDTSDPSVQPPPLAPGVRGSPGPGWYQDQWGNWKQGVDTGVPSTQRGIGGQIWDKSLGMFVPSTAHADTPGGTQNQMPEWLRQMPDGSGIDDAGYIYMWNPSLGQWARTGGMGVTNELGMGRGQVAGSVQPPPGQQPTGQQPPVQLGPNQAPPVQGQPNQTGGYYHPTTGAWVPAGGQSGLGGSYDPRTDPSRVWDDYFRHTQRGGMQQPSDFERYGFPTQGPGYNILDPSDPMYGVIPGTEGDAPGTKGIQPGEEGPLSTRGMLSASGEMGVETEGLGWNADSIRANINNLPPGDFRMDKLADLLQMYEKFESGVATASSAADAKLALETMKQEYETQETIAANTLLATQRDEDQEWQQELHRQKAFIDSQEAAFNEASRKAEITGLWDGTQTLSAMNLEAQNAAARTAAERATEREQWQRGETEAERKYQGERAKAQEELAGQAADRQEVLDKAALVARETEKIRTQKSLDEFSMTTKMMMAEATGILEGNPTMAGETFAMTRAMQEAEITGKFRPYEMTADGPAAMEPWGTGQTTMAAKSLAFQQDLQMYKEDTTRQLSENTLKIAENANQTNILIESKKRAIEGGKLNEAIDARRGQQKIEQDKLGLETNRLKLETVMSMANPVTLMIFQRSGLMPVLERLLGVELGFPDFPQMLPEGETIPTQQYLTYGSPMDRRLMMTEASLRSGMSDADVQSVIHRQMPGGMGVAIGYRGEGR